MLYEHACLDVCAVQVLSGSTVVSAPPFASARLPTLGHASAFSSTVVSHPCLISWADRTAVSPSCLVLYSYTLVSFKL